MDLVGAVDSLYGAERVSCCLVAFFVVIGWFVHGRGSSPYSPPNLS